MKRTTFLLLALLALICTPNVWAQQTLTIDVIESGNKVLIKAVSDKESQSFTIEEPDRFFSSCYKVDHIVSRTDRGNPRVIKELENEIGYLSKNLIKPFKSRILQCDLINIKISEPAVRIPFEFLLLDEDFIYKQKPILFSYDEVNPDDVKMLNLQKGFIVCDLTADPENACGKIHKKIDSEFHYITDIDINTVRNAKAMDFILMSIHGDIDIESCVGSVGVNGEELYPSVFSQRNVKLIYFDSCHLGKGKNFVDRFHKLNAEYFIGPIISNEAGNSSTKTILTFFKYLENNDPLESLMKTKKDMIAYSKNNILVELWYAAPFRLYKMN